MQPLKSARQNKVFKITICSFDDISCDKNGAYLNSNNIKRDFLMKITDSRVTVKKFHVVSGEFFYREKNKRKAEPT